MSSATPAQIFVLVLLGEGVIGLWNSHSKILIHDKQQLYSLLFEREELIDLNNFLGAIYKNFQNPVSTS